MDVALLLSLFAARTIAIQQMAGNFTNFVSSTLSCEGTSTYAFTPLETVTITVGGEYTFSGNGTPSDIYYTPPPPCSEVIDPDMSTTLSEEKTSITLFPAIPTTTPSLPEPTWTTVCSTSFYSSNMTANSGAPYANTTNPAVTSCATVPVYNSPIFSASFVSSAHSGPVPEIQTETPSADPKLSTLPAESVAPPRISVSKAASEVGSGRSSAVTVTVTKKTPVPLSPTGGPNNAGPTFPGGGSDVVTPNSKQTPTPQPTPGPTTQPRATNTHGGNDPNTNSPDLPNNSNNNPQPTGGSSNDNKPTSGNNNNNARPTGGNGNNNNPSPGDNNTNDQNSKPTDSNKNNNNNNNNNQNNNSPTDGNRKDSPTGSNNNNGNQNNNSPTAGINNQNNAANPTPSGNGLGSIINSVFNSPFSTAVGVTTSFGLPSATATLVAGVPIQVGSSSVYIGGSNIALPTGTSRALVTIAGQTFTVAPSAIVAGSSTLTLHRPESISYSPVQAATLAASTITHDGITVTVEPTAAVISGRTFTIGLNAPEATTVINSQTITFNSNGIIFPSVGAGAQSTNANGVVFPASGSPTTYRPALTTAPAYIITTLGRLTFSIDSSEAIISGTTYRIGAGSLNSMTTTVLDGTTLVFGPSGVVLPHSTTLKPTAPQLTGAETSASAATRVVESSSSGTGTVTALATPLGSGGAGARVAVPSACAYVSNAVCAVVVVLVAGMLPLSLVL